ncbi:zinc-finger domain-containing protein [Tumebacillus permanentifrigoris]|uniref:Uncharacterized protein DUF2602 n=1 Tax=Tumebacillus permanentifrigoris TaxID=378543 RepID=A0A316D2G8_9BACL|nr:zinc-finger domain-containing protein [Tumebacillus permanentifrigoris]PWK05082.1 uncharacterized protein DUF2602 [Tumebacillus permanentifrigoris]
MNSLLAERRRVLNEIDRVQQQFCVGCTRFKPVGRESKESWCQQNCVVTFQFEEIGERLVELSAIRRQGKGVTIHELQLRNSYRGT